MKPSEDEYLEALGRLPQAKNERLAETRACFDQWLALQHTLKQADRYHLHESAPVAGQNLMTQIQGALGQIHQLRSTMATLDETHTRREVALQKEMALKAMVRRYQGAP